MYKQIELKLIQIPSKCQYCSIASAACNHTLLTPPEFNFLRSTPEEGNVLTYWPESQQVRLKQTDNKKLLRPPRIPCCMPACQELPVRNYEGQRTQYSHTIWYCTKTTHGYSKKILQSIIMCTSYFLVFWYFLKTGFILLIFGYNRITENLFKSFFFFCYTSINSRPLIYLIVTKLR